MLSAYFDSRFLIRHALTYSPTPASTNPAISSKVTSSKSWFISDIHVPADALQWDISTI